MAKRLNQQEVNVNLAFTADISKAKQQLQDLRKQLDKMLSNTASLKQLGITKQIEEAKIAAASLKTQLEGAINVDTGKLDLGKFSQSLKQSGYTLEKYRDYLMQLGPEGAQAFATLAQSITTAEIPLRRTNKLLTDFATTLKNTARWQISSTLLHSFMGTLQTAYHYAEDLNKSLNNIRIVTGQNTEQMAKFAAEANRAALALNTTTNEYAKASLIYYQQGLSDAEVKERTDVTVKLANITRETSEDISQNLTAIWNNFAKGGQNLEYYADVITSLGAATASSSAEISQGLEKFAAVADTVGLSYEYATAALATVTATTRQSADIVGNAFKTLFARLEGLKLGETLEDETDLNKYSAALATVGVNIKEINGEIKSMDQILDELGSKWNTLAKDQQMALANTVAGVRQYTQLIALMDNWDFFQDNLKIAKESTGTLQEQADVYAESWEAARKRVKAAAEDIYTTLLDDKFFINMNNGFAEVLKIIKSTINSLGGVKGLLLVIGNTILNTFGNQIAKGLQNTVYHFQMLTKAGNEAVQSQRNAANQALQNMFAQDQTPTNVAMGNAYAASAQVQQAYLDNAKQMTEEQRSIAQILLDQQNILTKNVASQKAATEELQEQVNLSKRYLDNSIKTSKITKAEQTKIDKFLNAKTVASTASQTGNKLFTPFYGKELDEASINEIKNRIQELNTIFKDSGEVMEETFGVKGAKAFQTFQQQIESASNDPKKIEEALNSLFEKLDINFSKAEKDIDDLRDKYAEDCPKIVELLEKVQEQSGYLGAGIGEVIAGATQARSQANKNSNNMKNLPGGATNIYQTVTQNAQAITTAAMAVSNLKGIVDTWTDSTASGLQKVISTVTSLGMVVPMVMRTIQQGGGIALAIGAAVTAVAAGISFIIDIIESNSIENKIKVLQEDSALLAENLQRTKSYVQDLQSSFDSYKSVIETLDKCIKGTDEWKNSLQEVNNTVLDILDKYPELAKIEGFVSYKNGQYTINEDIYRAELEKTQQQLFNSQLSQIQNTINIDQLKIQELEAKIERSEKEKRSPSRDRATRFVLSAQEQSDIEKDLQDLQKEVKNSTDNLYTLINGNLSNINDLGKNILVNTNAIDYFYKTYLKAREQDVYDNEKLFKEYQKYVGLEKAEYVDFDDDKFTYSLNGEEKEVTEETVRTTLALIDAEQWLQNNAESLAKVFAQLEKTASKSGQGLANILSGNLSNSSFNEISGLGIIGQNYGGPRFYNYDRISELLGVKESDLPTIAQAFGFDTIEKLGDFLSDKIQDFYNSYFDLPTKLVSSVREAFKNIDDSDFSQNIRKSIGDILTKAFVQSGEQSLDSITEIFNNLDSDEASVFADIIQSIDWDNITVESFASTLSKAGIEVKDLTDYLQDFIDAMKSTDIKSFDQMAEKYKTITDITKDLKTDDVISAEDFEELSKNAQDYFWRMADGTYKLIGEADKFQKLIQDEQNIAFHSNKQNIVNRNNDLRRVSNYDLDNLSINESIDLIKVLGDQSAESAEKIAKWEDQIKKGIIPTQELKDTLDVLGIQYEDINEEIKQNQELLIQLDFAQASTYNSLDELQEAYKTGAISTLSAYNSAADHLADSLGSLDEEELTNFSKHLQRIAKDTDDLADDITEDSARIVAKGIMRMNQAVDALAKDWEEWHSILTKSSKSSEEYSDALSKVRNVLSDLLDIDVHFIKDEQWIADNLDKIALAAKGNAEAIDELKTSILTPIVAQIAIENKIDESLLLSELSSLQDMLDNFGPLEAGFDIDDTRFLAACNKLIETTKMTTDQANAIFGALGFDTNFVQEDQVVKTQIPKYVTHHERKDLENGNWDETTWTEIATEQDSVGATVPAYALGAGTVPKINKLVKKAGGSFNNLSSANAGSKSSGSKTKKDKKIFSDEIDRYWDLNNAIQVTNNSLKKHNAKMQELNTLKSHAKGDELIANLKQENSLIKTQDKLIEQQISNYKGLYEEQKRELKDVKKELKGFGGTFDGNALTNYKTMMVNAINEYNKAIEIFNASAQTEADKQALEAAEKHYSKVTKAISRYQTLYYNDMANTQEQIDAEEQRLLENRLKIIENNFKAWETKIDIKLNLSNSKREWNDFLKEIKSDFKQVYQDLTINTKINSKNFKTYQKDIKTTLKSISDVEQELTKLKNGEESKLFSSISEAEDELTKLQSQLINQGKELTNIYQDTWNQYIEGLNQVQNKLQDIDKEYDRISDQLQYEKQLIELLYGDKAYKLMDKYYNTQQDNIETHIATTKEKIKFWEDAFEKAYEVADKSKVIREDSLTWTEDMKIAYDNMQESQDTLNNLILDGVKNLQEGYLNTLNEIFKQTDKNIWGTTFDQMKDNWEYMQEIASEYLDDVEGAYEIQVLANKIDKEIAKTLSTNAQQKLQKLREKEIETLREKEDLTQNDIDLAEARYNIALKEIALEEAQNAKNSMKLVRDVSGNWTYQYVANEADTLSRQQDLLDASYKLYEIADKAYTHTTEMIINTYQTMQDKVRAIAEDTTITEEEKMKKIQKIYDTYLPQIEKVTKNSEVYRQEAIIATAKVFSEVCNADYTAYDNLTTNQKRLVDSVKQYHLSDYEELRSKIIEGFYPDLYAKAESSFNEINITSQTIAADVIKTWAGASDTDPNSVVFKIKQAFAQMEEAAIRFDQKLDALLGDEQTRFNNINEELGNLNKKIRDIPDLIESMVTDSTRYLESLRTAVSKIASEWERVIGDIKEAKELMDEQKETPATTPSDGSEKGNKNKTGKGTSLPETGNTTSGTGTTASSTSVGNTNSVGKPRYMVYGDKTFDGNIGLVPLLNAPVASRAEAEKWISTYGQAMIKAGKLTNGSVIIDEYDTGGYTGEWSSNGRLALLHQKELVLNQEDTANILQAVRSVRDLTNLNDSIGSAIASSIKDLVFDIIANTGNGVFGNTTNNASDNKFYINAEFPNATEVESIREAILSLPNLASQYIN